MLLLKNLATTQPFSRLKIETSARAELYKAKKEYCEGELTKSANLFLKSWRILRNEYESNLFRRVDYSLTRREQFEQQEFATRENKERLFLSLVALHDLAVACVYNKEKYKDLTGKCKLDVYALRYGWEGNTITEVLEIEENGVIKSLWPIGSGVAHVLPLKDPLGRILEEAESFGEAAFHMINICSLQIDCFSESLKEYREGYNFFRDNLGWIHLLASLELKPTIKNTHDIEQMRETREKTLKEDEKTKRRLVVKMEDWKSKNNPLDKKDEEELGDLLDRLYVISPSEELIRQLEQFYTKDAGGIYPYKDKSFEYMQEKGDDEGDIDEDDVDEEEMPLLSDS
ncbi:hypothetical protein BGZ60DRAFT_429799 [Tricladium varicosporioides]|nr:hypothetical protein BGZ60DRAFT_429799 [Hymenoscyphus varicosporioides]